MHIPRVGASIAASALGSSLEEYGGRAQVPRRSGTSAGTMQTRETAYTDPDLRYQLPALSSLSESGSRSGVRVADQRVAVDAMTTLRCRNEVGRSLGHPPARTRWTKPPPRHRRQPEGQCTAPRGEYSTGNALLRFSRKTLWLFSVSWESPCLPAFSVEYGVWLMTIHYRVSSWRGRPRACPTSGHHKGCPYPSIYA